MFAIDVLKACPLFYELYDKEIESLVGDCYVSTLYEGDYIVKKGDEGAEIFVILEGSAVVEIETSEKVLKIANLTKGDVFGELVLINQLTRTADIRCETHVDILVIDYNKIYQLYKKKPKIFSIIILNLSRLLTKRLSMANQTIQELRKLK